MPAKWISTTSDFDTSSGITLSLDTEVAAIGDLMIAVIAFDLTVTADPTFTVIAPAGWTLIRRDSSPATAGTPGTATILQLVYWKYAVLGDQVFSWTTGLLTGVPILGTLLVYRYAAASTPIDTSAGPGTPATTSITAPSVVATQNNDLILTAYSMTNSVPSGTVLAAPQTKRLELARLGMRLVVGEELRGQDEATGTRLCSSSDVLGKSVGQTIALKSAPYEAVVFQDNYKSKVLRCLFTTPYDARLETTLGKLLTVIGTDDNNIGGLFGEADFLPDETV